MKITQNIIVGIVLSFIGFSAAATSIDWTGGYRIEYVDIDRPTLSEPGGKKSYGLNYLYLQPQMIASDGINIVSRFDILSNEKPAYRNSQMGSFLGSGLSTGAGANVTAQNSDSSNLRVSQLYLNVNQENGVFVVGRAPIEFGLGITHNAGGGAFDHWMDTKDMISYKFIVDNISFMPLLSRNYQSSFEIGKTISDQAFVFEYDNKDIGATAGVFWQTRNTSFDSNDVISAPAGIPQAATQSGGYSAKTINLYLARQWSAFEFKLEASFLTGQTGAVTATGEEINYNSYAVSSEILLPARDTSTEYGLKFGVVSGDNKDTAAFEGYQLDQNYDVAILLFNHRMGNGTDYFNSGTLHANDTVGGNGLTVPNSADDEAIGNTIYLAPSFKYLWNEKLDLKTTLIYAQLLASPDKTFVDFKKDLGIELDIELIYKPRERVTWSTGFGMLSPGAAWSGGSGNNWDTKMNYGFTTKAAITF
jgi:hypothetical protein